MPKISVVIADDHKLLRSALSTIINANPAFEVIAACGDSSDAVELIKTEAPDIVLMDINILPFSGLEATKKIKELAPSCSVIGMSAYSEPAYAKKMLQMGARGYVTKNSSKEEIITAMLKVHSGDIYVCEEIKNMLGDRLGTEPGLSSGVDLLTATEIKIVELIRIGQSSKEISLETGIKVKTVEMHRHNILQKLKLKNTFALVDFVHNNADYHLLAV